MLFRAKGERNSTDPPPRMKALPLNYVWSISIFLAPAGRRFDASSYRVCSNRSDRIDFSRDIGPERSCRAGSLSDLRRSLGAGAEPVAVRYRTHAAFRYRMPSPSLIFAVMRSPIDRALSDYWYCYHESADPAHSAARSMSAGAFRASGFSNGPNGQARYLSGAAFEGGTPEDEELYARAQRTMNPARLRGCVRKLRADA